MTPWRRFWLGIQVINTTAKAMPADFAKDPLS